MWLAAAFLPTRPLSDQPWKTQRGKNVLISDSPSGPTRSSSDVRSIIMSYVCNLNLSHFPIKLMSSQYPCSAVNKCTSKAYCVPSMLCTRPKVNRLPRRASTSPGQRVGRAVPQTEISNRILSVLESEHMDPVIQPITYLLICAHIQPRCIHLAHTRGMRKNPEKEIYYVCSSL